MPSLVLKPTQKLKLFFHAIIKMYLCTKHSSKIIKAMLHLLYTLPCHCILPRHSSHLFYKYVLE